MEQQPEPDPKTDFLLDYMRLLERHGAVFLYGWAPRTGKTSSVAKVLQAIAENKHVVYVAPSVGEFDEDSVNTGALATMAEYVRQAGGRFRIAAGKSKVCPVWAALNLLQTPTAREHREFTNRLCDPEACDRKRLRESIEGLDHAGTCDSLPMTETYDAGFCPRDVGWAHILVGRRGEVVLTTHQSFSRAVQHLDRPGMPSSADFAKDLVVVIDEVQKDAQITDKLPFRFPLTREAQLAAELDGVDLVSNVVLRGAPDPLASFFRNLEGDEHRMGELPWSRWQDRGERPSSMLVHMRDGLRDLLGLALEIQAETATWDYPESRHHDAAIMRWWDGLSKRRPPRSTLAYPVGMLDLLRRHSTDGFSCLEAPRQFSQDGINAQALHSLQGVVDAQPQQCGAWTDVVEFFVAARDGLAFPVIEEGPDGLWLRVTLLAAHLSDAVTETSPERAPFYSQHPIQLRYEPYDTLLAHGANVLLLSGTPPPIPNLECFLNAKVEPVPLPPGVLQPKLEVIYDSSMKSKKQWFPLKRRSIRGVSPDLLALVQAARAAHMGPFYVLCPGIGTAQAMSAVMPDLAAQGRIRYARGPTTSAVRWDIGGLIVLPLAPRTPMGIYRALQGRGVWPSGPWSLRWMSADERNRDMADELIQGALRCADPYAGVPGRIVLLGAHYDQPIVAARTNELGLEVTWVDIGKGRSTAHKANRLAQALAGQRPDPEGNTILAALAGGPLRTRQIAEHCAMRLRTTQRHLRRLLGEGSVRQQVASGRGAEAIWNRIPQATRDIDLV